MATRAVHLELGNRQVQKSDRINLDCRSGLDQLPSTRIFLDHEKMIKLNEIETFNHLKVQFRSKMAQIKKDL